MKIKIDRTTSPQGDLVFTVTVSEPKHSYYGDNEVNVMRVLDESKDKISSMLPEENRTKENVLALMHSAKQNMFTRILENLKFEIENEFRPKFQPICQEIYNWIYDNQSSELRNWMMEFNPNRTKYYFDNDRVAAMSPMPQESEHDLEIE